MLSSGNRKKPCKIITNVSNRVPQHWMNLRNSIPRNDLHWDPIGTWSSTEHQIKAVWRYLSHEAMLCPCPLSASGAFACCRGDGTKFMYFDLKTIPNPTQDSHKPTLQIPAKLSESRFKKIIVTKWQQGLKRSLQQENNQKGTDHHH